MQKQLKRATEHTQQPPTSQPPLPSIVFFQCPRCPHQLPGTKPAFHHKNMDTRIWCNSCQRSWFIRNWRCQCGLPWHTCPRHKDEPDRLRAILPVPTEPTPKATPRPKKARQLGEGRDSRILQWLDQPSSKRRKMEPIEVDLEEGNASHIAPKRPNLHCLGPKLLAKFPRLAQQHDTSEAREPPQQLSQPASPHNPAPHQATHHEQELRPAPGHKQRKPGSQQHTTQSCNQALASASSSCTGRGDGSLTARTAVAGAKDAQQQHHPAHQRAPVTTQHTSPAMSMSQHKCSNQPAQHSSHTDSIATASPMLLRP